MDWFKCHHGAALDAKYLAVAERAKVAPALVVALMWALCDHASQQRPRGSIVGFDLDGFAAWHRAPPDDCRRVLQVMGSINRPLHDGSALIAWARRQDQKTDSTRNDRQKAFRQRQRLAKALNVTPCNAVTDRGVTARNAVSNDVTPRNASREERKLFSALDVALDVKTSITPESVYLGSTDSASARRDTPKVDDVKPKTVKPGFLRKVFGQVAG